MKVALKFGVKIHSIQCKYLQFTGSNYLVPVLNME